MTPLKSLSFTSTLIDPFGRKLNYLRIAVTDRCNLRCTYCMPAEGVPFIPHQEIMRFEEMERVVGVLLAVGLQKVRITGGEPLVRKGLIDFLRRLRRRSSQLKLHLTTNGLLLKDYINDLQAIGLDGINLSLDTLSPEKFQTITRRNGFFDVWEGLQKVIESGILLKINVVVQRGVNDDEIVALAELARTFPLEVRFIEQMPFDGLSQRVENPISAMEILEILKQHFPDLEEMYRDQISTARRFKIPEFKGVVGIIAGYSRTFCQTCNRLRLTSTGVLKTCLYDQGKIDLKELIRAGVNDMELLQRIREAVALRAKDGFEEEASVQSKLSMAQIGG